jgi:hypothetical protein
MVPAPLRSILSTGTFQPHATLDDPSCPAGDYVVVKMSCHLHPTDCPDNDRILTAVHTMVLNIQFGLLVWTSLMLRLNIEAVLTAPPLVNEEGEEEDDVKEVPSYGDVRDSILEALNEECSDDSLFPAQQSFLPMGKQPKFPFVLNHIPMHNQNGKLVTAAERLADILTEFPANVRANPVEARWLLAKHLLPGAQTASLLIECNSLDLAEIIIKNKSIILRGTQYWVERLREQGSSSNSANTASRSVTLSPHAALPIQSAPSAPRSMRHWHTSARSAPTGTAQSATARTSSPNVATAVGLTLPTTGHALPRCSRSSRRMQLHTPRGANDW